MARRRLDGDEDPRGDAGQGQEGGGLAGEGTGGRGLSGETLLPWPVEVRRVLEEASFPKRGLIFSWQQCSGLAALRGCCGRGITTISPFGTPSGHGVRKPRNAER